MQVRERGWVLPFAILFARHHIRVGVFGLVLVAHLHGLAPLSGGAIGRIRTGSVYIVVDSVRGCVPSIHCLSIPERVCLTLVENKPAERQE